MDIAGLKMVSFDADHSFLGQNPHHLGRRSGYLTVVTKTLIGIPCHFEILKITTHMLMRKG